MAKMKCPCRYVYDPEVGDPKQGIPPGTKFEDLPDTWRCPRCKRKKEKFVPVEEELSFWLTWSYSPDILL